MKSFKLPDGILAQHVIALGKTGSGKSTALRVLVEGILDDKKPVCIIDPKGDWWGLKSSADGKHAGYPVVIFGGAHADVPLNALTGGDVAELVATGNRPCIIDLGGWMVGERTRFFIDFASALFRTSTGPRVLVIDEVHNFAPQGKILDPDAGKMLHWANRLASEGRGKGVTILAASQRPQKVHKVFLTSAETLIAKRVIHPLDRAAVKEWIDGCGDIEKGKEVIASLATMPRPDAWIWSPEIGFGPERITFPMFETYDSFKPRGNDGSVKLKGWAEVNLDEVRTKLSKVVEEAKANDPMELKKRIRELEKQLTAKPAAALAPNVETKVVEKPVLKDAHVARVEHVCAAFDKAVAKLCTTYEIGEKLAGTRFDQALEVTHGIRAAIMAVRSNGHPSPAGTKPGPIIPQRPTVTHAQTKRPEISGPNIPSSDVSLGKGELRILAAIAQHPAGVTREQLTVLTGYKRSSRDTYLQRLRSAGLIDDGPTITCTPAGEDALGSDWQPLPTGDALRAHHLATLPEGERRILEVVAGVYPNSIHRDNISDHTGYKRSSRDTYLQRLSARQLVKFERGNVIASEQLFG